METPESELPPIPTEGEPKEDKLVTITIDEKSKVKVKKVKSKTKAPKVKAKVKAKVKPAATRKLGPGTKKFKFKDPKVVGKCDVLGCTKKAKTPRSFRCHKHTKLIRKQQLKENNKTWHARIKDGTAKHHAVYTDPGTGKQRVTEWASLNPDKAKAYVKAEKSIVDLKTFVPLLSLVKEKPAKKKPSTKAEVKGSKKAKAVKPKVKKAAAAAKPVLTYTTKVA